MLFLIFNASIIFATQKSLHLFLIKNFAIGISPRPYALALMTGQIFFLENFFIILRLFLILLKLTITFECEYCIHD